MYFVLCFVCVIVAVIGSGVRFGYSVVVNGEEIAVVSDKNIVSSAVKVIENKVSGTNIKSHISTPKYTLTITSPAVVQNDKNEIADKLIKTSDNIVKGVKATIDNKTYIFTDNESDIVEDYLEQYEVEDAYCESEFVGTVSIEDGLFLSSDVNSRVGIKTVLGAVPVQTIANIVTKQETQFDTVTVMTNDLLKGTQKVECEGSNGVTQIVEQVTYLNGKETERVKLSESVLSEPVNKVVLVGTSLSNEEVQKNAEAHSLGFIFPISDSYRIGDVFGTDGKHKGIDICANKGVSILAVKGGTVIRSGWNAGYGNCVEIDHGNGYVTRYGHASELLCAVGQTVDAGDVIAKVGSTGNSTGNHLHFEVILNGTRVNPAPYLNIQ